MVKGQNLKVFPLAFTCLWSCSGGWWLKLEFLWAKSVRLTFPFNLGMLFIMTFFEILSFSSPDLKRIHVKSTASAWDLYRIRVKPAVWDLKRIHVKSAASIWDLKRIRIKPVASAWDLERIRIKPAVWDLKRIRVKLVAGYLNRIHVKSTASVWDLKRIRIKSAAYEAIYAH
jgi:hypothetical protein